jgi:hypothetical protein
MSGKVYPQKFGEENPFYKHGHAKKYGKTSKMYWTWCSMRKRCYNAKTPSYRNYGARGITVCERWMTFANFLADMGDKPEGLSLERIDNDGNYEPGNCKWATPAEQNRNNRFTRMVTFNCETLCVVDWAKKTGIKRVTLEARLLAGWSAERALTEPTRRFPPRSS